MKLEKILGILRHGAWTTVGDFCALGKYVSSAVRTPRRACPYAIGVVSFHLHAHCAPRRGIATARVGSAARVRRGCARSRSMGGTAALVPAMQMLGQLQLHPSVSCVIVPVVHWRLQPEHVNSDHHKYTRERNNTSHEHWLLPQAKCGTRARQRTSTKPKDK